MGLTDTPLWRSTAPEELLFMMQVMSQLAWMWVICFYWSSLIHTLWLFAAVDVMRSGENRWEKDDTNSSCRGLHACVPYVLWPSSQPASEAEVWCIFFCDDSLQGQFVVPCGIVAYSQLDSSKLLSLSISVPLSLSCVLSSVSQNFGGYLRPFSFSFCLCISTSPLSS